MRTCHVCHHELDPTALIAGRCPECNTPIPRKAAKTVQDTVFLDDFTGAPTTPDNPPVEFGDESLDLALPAPDDPSRESHSVAADGTVEFSPRLSDEETSPVGTHEEETEDSAGPPIKSPTVPDHGDITLDFSSDDLDSPDRGHATHDLAGEATVDLGLGASGGAYDTIDPGDQESESIELLPTSEEEVQKLRTTWRGTFETGTRPGQTIRQDATVSGFRATLPIKPRFISERRSSTPTTHATFKPGEVPDYELLDVIGEGGMGVVYSARQSSIARTVAIKMLKPSKKIGEEQRDKFISEAVVTGELDHPNIVPIYDLGANESGALFYSMKRVKGTPWDKVIKEKSLDENLQILMRVADAVAFAHAHGVVHRDLKPENVMLGDYGEVLVMDWGLARVTPEFANADSIYQADSLGGTPAYMAPEMARGPAERIDFRSDVYLLGAILYEIIGGRPPHSGRDVMQCLMAAAQNRIDPIAYDGELKSIALKAMAAHREDRYPSVKKLQDAIRTYQSHSESLVLTANARQSLAKARETGDYELFERSVFGFQEALLLWDGNQGAGELLAEARLDYAQLAYDKGDYDLAISRLDRDNVQHSALLTKVERAKTERDARERRLRTFRRLVAALVLLIAAILGFSTVIISRKHQQAVAARELEAEARQQAEERRLQAEEAQRQEAEARRIAEEAKVKEEEAKLQALEQKEIADDKRVEAEEARELERQAKEREAEQRAAAVRAKEAEEYEAYIAQIGLASEKIEENAFEYALELLRDCPVDLRHWEWGRLAYLCQLSTSQVDMGKPVDAVAISPVAPHYAVGDWSGRTTIRDMDSGEVLHGFDFGQYVHSVAYSPDGRHLAAGGSDQRVHVVNLETGETRALQGHEGAILSVEFSPDGQQLLTSSIDKTARRWDVATGRELQTLRGHTWWVWTAVFSPDQSRIVTTGQDGRAVVWELVDGRASNDPRGMYRKKTEFPGHEGAVFAARFSPDGRLVATGGYDNTIRVWNPDEVQPVDIQRRLEGLPDVPSKQIVLTGHSGPVRAVDFSPTNPELLASASHDNTLRLWDVTSGRQVRALRGHSGRVFSCNFSPDGNQLLSGGHDDFVRLWNVEGYQEVRVLRGRVLQGHQDAVLAAHFSNDGTQVITASRDRTAALWDVRTGDRLREFSEGHQFLASSVAFFEDGRRLVTGAGDNSVRIWDVATGTELQSLTPTGRMASLAVSPDGRWIVTGSPGNEVQVWEVQSGNRIASLQGHPAEVTAAVFSSDGRELATGDERGNVRYWRSTGDGRLFELARELNGHNRTVTAIRFLPDSDRLVSASGDNTCAQWDLTTGQELLPLVLKHPAWVSSLDVTSDGRYAVTACEDRIVRLWSLADARVVDELESDDAPFNSVSMAPNGQAALLTSSTAGQVKLWRFSTTGGASDLELWLDFNKPNIGGSVWAAQFAPGGDKIATIGGNDAALWDLTTARQQVRFSPHTAVADATLSADGRYVVTGSWDGSAKIWDAQTGQAIRRLDGGHSNYVNSAEFSPDGRWILTASDDGTARLWDFATGEPSDIVLRGHQSRILHATFSPNGSKILTTGGDHTARIWDAATGRELQVLEGHTRPVLAGVFSSGGNYVLTGSDDNTARLWDTTSGEHLRTFAGHTSGVTSVAFSPDNRRVLTGSEDRTAKLWDPRPESPKEILTLTGHKREVTSVAFSPDGQLALTGSRDGTVILWLALDWRGELALVRLSHQQP